MIEKDSNKEEKDYFNDNNQKSKWKTISNFIFTKRILFLFLIFLCLFVYLFAAAIFVPKEWIVSGGSTSVDPIMEELSPWYKENYKEDFIYNSMGSVAASSGVENGYYDLGFESQKVMPEKSSKYESFTIAHDYFIILFNLPQGLKGAGIDNSIPLPGVDNNELGEIMSEVYGNKNETWKDFSDEVKKITTINPFQTPSDPNVMNEKISTFTRESGSGTRDYMEKNIIGKSGSTNNASVQSSNGAMMNAILNSPSSMGYLSFSYMNEILNLQKDNNLSVASVDTNLPYIKDNNKAVFNKIYSLKRPFAGLVRLNAKNVKVVLEFINRILWSSPEQYSSYNLDDQIKNNPISQLIYNLGFEPVTYVPDTYNSVDDNPNVDIKTLMNDYNIDTVNNPF